MEVPNSGSNEQFVALEDLAATIRDLIPTCSSNAVDELDQSDILNSNQNNSNRDSTRMPKPSVDCIFVDNDQYFDSSKPEGMTQKEASKYKSILKSMKSVIQKGETFVSSFMDHAGEILPIFAVADVSFWVLRDFGTCLMKHEKDTSFAGACQEIIEKYPGRKRVIKTLCAAIDSYMRRGGFGVDNNRYRAIFLLYSKLDDRFDMVCFGPTDTREPAKSSRGKK